MENKNLQSKGNILPTEENVNTESNIINTKYNKKYFKTIAEDFEETVKVIDEIHRIELGFEDDFLTRSLYQKLTFEEGMKSLYTFASIVTACISYEGKKSNDENDYQVYCLIMVSIFNIIFCYHCIMSCYLSFLLEKSGQRIFGKTTFFESKLWINCVIEIIWSLLGPNYGFYKVIFTTSSKWNMVAITYDLNDLMLVFAFPRIFTLITFLLLCTPFYNDRAHRVNKQMGSSLNFLFAIKAIFYSHPVYMIFTLILICVIPLSYMLKIIEGPVWDGKSIRNFNYYENCVWCVLVTMTTVGYGDYYPDSNLGRLICIAVAFTGSALISLIILVTGNKLMLSKTEKKIYDFGNRLDARKDLDNTYTENFGFSFLYKIKFNLLKIFSEKNPFLLTNDPQYQSKKNELFDILYNKIACKKINKEAS